jgi:hypothetical protein
MFLRAKTRKKDGKHHRYWSVVENRRTGDDRVLQLQALYLGVIDGSQDREQPLPPTRASRQCKKS